MWFSLNGNSVPRRRPFSFRLTIHVCKIMKKKKYKKIVFLILFLNVGNFC